MMNKESVGDYALATERVEYSHLVFSLGSEEAVDALTESFREDGWLSGPFRTA
nr:hypothetical protein [Streptococcus sp. NLN76]